MALINSSAVKGRCPICGAENAVCGGPSSVHPVDIVEKTTMPEETRELIIVEDDQGHTFQMTAEDAKAAGYTEVGGAKAQKQAANKAVKAAEDK